MPIYVGADALQQGASSRVQTRCGLLRLRVPFGPTGNIALHVGNAQVLGDRARKAAALSECGDSIQAPTLSGGADADIQLLPLAAQQLLAQVLRRFVLEWRRLPAAATDATAAALSRCRPSVFFSGFLGIVDGFGETEKTFETVIEQLAIFRG